MNKRRVGIVLSYGNTILNMLFGLFLSSYLLRMLGDASYGLYQTITSFTNYLVLLEFGVGTVLTRNLLVARKQNRQDDVDKIVSTMTILSAVLSLLILVVAVAFYFSIDSIYAKTMTIDQLNVGKRIFLLSVIYLLFSFFSQAVEGILLGMENYTFSQKLRILRNVIRTAALVVAVWKITEPTVIVVVDVIVSFLYLGVSWIFTKKKYALRVRWKNFDFSIIKDSLPLCFAILLQVVVNQANNNVDKFVIGILLSMESVAVYSVAQYIYSVFSSLTTIPITMYMPQVTQSIQEGKKGRELTDTLIQPCRLVAIIGGLIIGGFFAVGKPFITVVYGAEKIDAWIYALAIMLPMYINMTNGVIINVLDVLKKRHIRSFILVGTTALNLILTLVLIPYQGVMGAVIATAIATILGQIIIMNIYYQKVLGISIIYLFRQAYKRIIWIIAIAGIVAFAVANLIHNPLVSLSCAGMLFVILTLIGLLSFGLNEEEKNLCKMIFARIRRK